MHSLANSYMTADKDHDESDEMHWSQRSNMKVAQITCSCMTGNKNDHNDHDW